ncbi:hypothetical protein FRACYDRAFT_254816 [Fragilariopsis cylindrus CCMP1102]|uniref:Uncharacterized protein n=1 Tax=Fragilariopsis cylindrus CCMP1102 TaxID=635003 RepID=A0A1E7EKC9_9STRA|nr:hypothetical protein FRACYDRAFT_254816 [Fragilariopsis cylindrus CCMP1102]|eukprot:OEU06370.1 hypothetical protein FRACYDRAFT_254816 [Fragilariopsis cylindrus CCMP1102]
MLPTIDESSGLWTRTMKHKNNKNKRSITNNTDNDNDNDNDINEVKESSSSKRQRLVLSDNTNTSTNTNTNTNPFVDTSNKTVIVVSSAVITTNTQSFVLPTSDEIMKELCKIVAFDDSSDHKRSSNSSSSSKRRKIALKSLLTIRKWIKKSNNNNNNNMNSNSETRTSKNNNFVTTELFELGCIPTLLTFLEKNIQNNDIECISVVVSVIVKLTMTMNNNKQQIISLFVKRNGINLLLLANEKICSSDIGIIAAAGGGDGDGTDDDYGTTATKLVALKRIWNAIQNIIKLSTEILYKQKDDPSILTKIVTAGLDTLETVSTITVPSVPHVAAERDDAITDIATTDPGVSVTIPLLSSSTTSIIASGRASSSSSSGTTRSGMSKLIHKAAASSSSLLKVAITNNLNHKKQHKGSSISKQEQEQDDLKSIASSTSTSLLSTTSSSLSSSVSTSTSAKTTSLYPLIPKIMEHIFKTLRHTVMLEGFDVAFTEEIKYDLLSKSLISLTTNDDDSDGIGSGWNRNNNVLFAALKFYEYCFIGSNSNNKKQPITIPLLFNTQYHYEAIIPFVLQTITRNSVLANKYGAFEIIAKSIPYLDTNFIQKSSISSRMSQVWEQEQDDNDNNNNNKHTETDQQQHKHTTKSYKVGATQKRAQDILKMLHK